jgi:hypothetical protein
MTESVQIFFVLDTHLIGRMLVGPPGLTKESGKTPQFAWRLI